jgi:hypothetical protein
MTLNEVLHRESITTFVSGMYTAVPIAYANYEQFADLWHCSDYVVTSVAAGCVYLAKRKGPVI